LCFSSTRPSRACFQIIKRFFQLHPPSSGLSCIACSCRAVYSWFGLMTLDWTFTSFFIPFFSKSSPFLLFLLHYLHSKVYPSFSFIGVVLEVFLVAPVLGFFLSDGLPLSDLQSMFLFIIFFFVFFLHFFYRFSFVRTLSPQFFPGGLFLV